MSKNIIVIGCRDAGKTSLVKAMADLASAADRAANKMQTLAQVIEQQRSIPFTNPYKYLIAFDNSFKKSKPKKAYWHKGKKKFK